MNAIDLDHTQLPRTDAIESMSEIICRLSIGDEIFIEPERVVPFEHWLGHIPFAFWLVGALRPKRLVELGTHRGNSYCTFCQAICYHNLDCSAYAVDTWQGDTHMLPEEGLLAELKRYHDPLYGSFSSLIEMTFDGARKHFAPASIDLLHIDGTHTYDAVSADFETWLPTLSDRAVVLFHDINVRQNDFGVWRLWDDLTTRYPSFSFIHSHGLGVLGVGTDLPAAVRALFDLHDESELAGRVRRLFAARGAGVLQRLRAQTYQEDAETNAAKLIEANARNVEISAQAEEARNIASQTAAALAETDSQHQQLIQSEMEARANLSRLQVQLQAETARRDRALEEARVGKILLFQERERAEGVVSAAKASIAELRRQERENAEGLRVERENIQRLQGEFDAERHRLDAERYSNAQEAKEREDDYVQEVERLTAERGALEQQLASARESEDRTAQEVGRLMAALDMLHQELTLLSETQDSVARRLQEVYKSTSWRAALPLRLASRIARGEWAELARLYRVRGRP